MKSRLDQYLVQLKIAPSRTKAQELIQNGEVLLITPQGEQLATKSNQEVDLDNPPRIEITSNKTLRYVSRGGLKLEGALKKVGWSVSGQRVLDVGQSTGGFTDCVLQLGAAQVVGVDVGEGQLADSLRSDSRVIAIEKINVKDLAGHVEFKKQAATFDLIVIDASFISLRHVLPPVLPLLKKSGRVLALVKPQFEIDELASRKKLFNKKGIIKDVGLFATVKTKMAALCEANHLRLLDYFESDVKGRDGNQEFFFFAQFK